MFKVKNKNTSIIYKVYKIGRTSISPYIMFLIYYNSEWKYVYCDEFEPYDDEN